LGCSTVNISSLANGALELWTAPCFHDPPISQEKLQIGYGLPIASNKGECLSGGGMTERIDPTGLNDAAALEAQIADLKQVVAILRAELADMREQRDKSQSRAERGSLTAPC
jgi:hypothetical protein